MQEELCNNCNECDDCIDNETEMLIDLVYGRFSVHSHDFEDDVWKLISGVCETGTEYQFEAVMRHYKPDYY